MERTAKFFSGCAVDACVRVGDQCLARGEAGATGGADNEGGVYITVCHSCGLNSKEDAPINSK